MEGSFQAVLWDLDGTLLNFKKGMAAAMKKCFSLFSLGTCSAEMLELYTRINDKYWERLERGELTRNEVLVGRFQEFFAACGLDPGLAEEFNRAYKGNSYAYLNDGALETVEALRGRAAQYAVTNGSQDVQYRKLRKTGLDGFLDGVFISEELGVEKPMAGFFQAVFAKIPPYSRDRILIVGDSLTSDMKGGVNAGIKTCWFNPEGKENTSGLRLDYEIRRLEEVLSIVGNNF